MTLNDPSAGLYILSRHPARSVTRKKGGYNGQVLRRAYTDAELLILTHPDISKSRESRHGLIFFIRNSVQATRLHASTAKTAVKLQIIAMIKELALGITPVRRFPYFGLEIFVRGYALPQADVNVLS